jgi:hypothetical protein
MTIEKKEIFLAYENNKFEIIQRIEFDYNYQILPRLSEWIDRISVTEELTIVHLTIISKLNIFTYE